MESKTLVIHIYAKERKLYNTIHVNVNCIIYDIATIYVSTVVLPAKIVYYKKPISDEIGYRKWVEVC